jgi:hypothetical protein
MNWPGSTVPPSMTRAAADLAKERQPTAESLDGFEFDPHLFEDDGTSMAMAHYDGQGSDRNIIEALDHMHYYEDPSLFKESAADALVREPSQQAQVSRTMSSISPNLSCAVHAFCSLTPQHSQTLPSS